jgi:hypothetical protein
MFKGKRTETTPPEPATSNDVRWEAAVAAWRVAKLRITPTAARGDENHEVLGIFGTDCYQCSLYLSPLFRLRRILRVFLMPVKQRRALMIPTGS